MKTKKHPKANLENYSKIFAQLGLVLALTIVYVLIQNKTFEKDLAMSLGDHLIDQEEIEENVEYELEEIQKEPKKEKPPVLENIEEVDNDEKIEETIFQDIDPTEDNPITEDDIIDVEDPEEFEKDVLLDFVEVAPLFPGCKGTQIEKKACFSKQISKFISKRFNADLAAELGLRSGVHRIHTVFKIDKEGNVVDIQARAPHARLQKEAIRVINLLPKMEPGMQGSHKVNVKFSMPISFRVE